MEEYHAYVQECIRTGIVPITISVYLRPRFVMLPESEDEYEDEDPEEPEVESEEAKDPTDLM